MDFANRHIGPDATSIDKMLVSVDVDSLDQLITETVPESIAFDGLLNLPTAISEPEVLADLRTLADENVVMRSLIGQGYYDTCLLYTSPSPRDRTRYRMPSSA